MSAFKNGGYKLPSLRLITIVAALVLSACGQKGPLYIPEQEKQQNPEKEPLAENNSEKRENL